MDQTALGTGLILRQPGKAVALRRSRDHFFPFKHNHAVRQQTQFFACCHFIADPVPVIRVIPYLADFDIDRLRCVAVGDLICIYICFISIRNNFRIVAVNSRFLDTICNEFIRIGG